MTDSAPLRLRADFSDTKIDLPVFRFSRSSRKHRIGRAFAWQALRAAGVPTLMPDGKLRWVGRDGRGVELELVGFVAAEDPNLVIIIHVMPTEYPRRES